mmetsp:Transcript_15065/g.35387  ORF Transcript_15065/g.35387 Transcript_15065/m.35387 type:complete len:170 (+) Transcript_15065:65-574(+)
MAVMVQQRAVEPRNRPSRLAVPLALALCAVVFAAASFCAAPSAVSEPNFAVAGALRAPPAAADQSADLAGVAAPALQKSSLSPVVMYQRTPGLSTGDAYQHPPPIPDWEALDWDGTDEGMCAKKYAECYRVCQRMPKRVGYDCRYDCMRKRRACLFKIKPHSEKYFKAK